MICANLLPLHVAKQLDADKFKILFVEPNLKSNDKFHLTSPTEAKEQCDIMVFLVAHKEFIDFEISSNIIILDFCGVKQVSKK